MPTLLVFSLSFFSGVSFSQELERYVTHNKNKVANNLSRIKSQAETYRRTKTYLDQPKDGKAVNYLEILIIASALALTGCASSGVLPMGREIYMISTSNEISPAYAKRAALTEANEYCGKLGKQIVPLSTNSGAHRDAFGDNIATFDFTFRCVSENDPEFQRPTMQKGANIIIEDRRR